MVASDYRKQARDKLAGKWGKAALIILVYCLILWVIGIIEGFLPKGLKTILDIANLVIEIPLAFGLIISLYKLYKGENPGVIDFLTEGFNNFKKAWLITLNTILKVLVPFILEIVSYIVVIVGFVTAGIGVGYNSNPTAGAGAIVIFLGFGLLIGSSIWLFCKSLYYQLAYLISIDNPELTAKQAVEKSEELMKGKRSRLFCLQFSFIGWAILSGFTFGIGMLFLLPYMQFSIIAFYKDVLGKDDTIETTKIEETPVQENIIEQTTSEEPITNSTEDNDNPIKEN